MSDASKGNAKAVAVRVKSQTGGKVGGSKKHMLREMPIPKYIDQDRMHLNSVIVKPKAAAELRAICNDRRKKRETKRALKSNSAIGFEGIITFGKEAQGDFDKLTVEEQNAAYQEIAEAIAERVNSTVTGLVAHRDETAPHAHFQMPGFDLDGHPLNNTIKRGVTSEFQTIAAKVIKRHVATIERGRGKYERLKAGAEWSEVVNKSVRKLHVELPAEISELEIVRDELLAKIEKNERLALRAAERAAESEKAAKRVSDYERRERDARGALERVEADLESKRLAAVQIIDKAESQISEGKAAFKALSEAVKAVVPVEYQAAVREKYREGTGVKPVLPASQKNTDSGLKM